MNQSPASYLDFIAPKYWPTWIGLFLLRALSLLPLPLIAFIGQSLGLVFYYISPARRRIAHKNISVCFPEFENKTITEINQKHFRLVGQSVLCVPFNWWASEKRFTKVVEVVGKEHLDKAILEGKNIIILAPHFMCLEVGGLILDREHTMTSMYQYAKNPLIDLVLIRGRTRFGGTLIERKEPLRKLIKLIRKGQPFYYLPDQDAGRKGVFVPFFHELASTMPMLGKFAKMGNAVVITCRNTMKPHGQGYLVELGAPIENFSAGDELKDAARMNEIIADMIREYPEQYFWVHKRFKTRPDRDTNFYN